MGRKIVADWKRLEGNHHSHRGFRERLGNVYPESWSPCCIQLSHAMNNAGLDIDPEDETLRRQMIYEGKIYLINVPSVLKYLAEKGYEKEVYKGSRAQISSELSGRRGIILFGTMHADLWLGEDIHRPDEYIPSALWEHHTTRSLGVSFFEVIEPLEDPFSGDTGGASTLDSHASSDVADAGDSREDDGSSDDQGESGS